ncbi:MAG TPA: efflux RND transporter periplasmic adaptor subunit [Tepidisphaeraceae bacterium]|nr:efflux RND transporter periplasmic adaptor subunit [Tepidisphaeraceae bacterium]
MNRKFTVGKLIAILVLLIVVGCAVAAEVILHKKGSDAEPPERHGSPTTAPANAAAPTTQPAPGSALAPGEIFFPATIDAFEMTDLYAKASGYIAQVNVDIGDHVKQGQVLATINDPEMQDDRAEAQATLAAKKQLLAASESAIAQAQQALEVARRKLASFEATDHLADITLQRQNKLFEGKAATDQQLDDVRAKADIARADVAVAQAKITSADTDLQAARAARAVAAAQVEVAAAQAQKAQTLLAYLSIIAPFDGVVTRRLVNRGDLVQAATGSKTTPLFTCQRIDVVRVFCQVPESAAADVHKGDAAIVKVFGLNWEKLSGTVTRISSALNPQTRTMRIEIDLDNPGERLRPGMYAQVTVTPRANP